MIIWLNVGKERHRRVEFNEAENVFVATSRGKAIRPLDSYDRSENRELTGRITHDYDDYLA